MKEKSVTNVAASVRQRLLNLRQAKGGDFNALLTQYAIERFLYRLSKSSLADKFVLKGAMLFRVWAEDLFRPTKDLDLLGFGEPSPDQAAASIKSILSTPVPDDGLIFDADSLVAVEIREQQEYGGIRVKFTARLGNARILMQVDIGFGDVVTPQAQRRQFPSLLGQEAPELQMYPPESVVSEKLEAIISLGIANSRMKDFYDLLLIFRLYELEDHALAQAIAGTFNRRQTALPAHLPVGLSDEYGNDPMAQQRWAEFMRRLHITDAPKNLVEVIDTIRGRMWQVIQDARDLP
ncbi:MAG: nucleotidyl transferase AbiEii/AbiGii toxin family protein [Calditrichaeota bacterium]|nr:nucleotidyl transferase AbiEii/AbiGii toxin family protein [Calditrichota bacterium]